ncbi:chemotaxis protein CheW [Amphritea sp. HPY]|uniref:chemotaxis protein CheA n=1 Tax=Amphritea sp. HPY TaxID=3421652 RepID=UPI003D7E9A73
MSIDLSQFISIFLEESYEGLDIMESSLLNLDDSDPETINTIFRAAHSIKGGAGTFGFDAIAEFTHGVETLLDKLRNDQLEISPELINLLLESVDCIRLLLVSSQDGSAAPTEQVDQLQTRVQQAINGETPVAEQPVVQDSEIAAHLTDAHHADSPETDLPETGSSETEVPQTVEQAPEANVTPQPVQDTVSAESDYWQIDFAPVPELLQQGHEPAFLFEALAELGTLHTLVDTTQLDDIEQFDPELIYLSWQLKLESDCSEDAIREVFEWAEDQCTLNIQRCNSNTPQTDNRWQISFIPVPGLLQAGHEPGFMLEALAELGKLEITADTGTLPQLDALQPEQLYLSWDLILTSECSREQIEEVFEWVEGECQLTIHALTNSDQQSSEDSSAQSVQEPITAVAEAVSDTAEASAPIPEPSPEITAVRSEPATARESTSTPASTPKTTGTGSNSQTPRKNASESSSVRVDTDKIDTLLNRVGELVITQAMLGQIGADLAEIAGIDVERLKAGLEQLERNTRDLQEDVMRVRMFPISFVFNRFPRLVHDVSSKLGKQVELKISGEQTEIDKTVMEKIGDPLVHLIRNSLDHGLETAEDRKAAGKPATGTLKLSAYHQGGFFVIDIEDDGRGLNSKVIYEKAISNGLITAEQQLSDSEINELIFRPGFSTAEQVSDLSGRGVGMDVVRRNIESLGGNIRLSSKSGKGTKISVRLPLTLAIMDGQLVRLDKETYIIPLISIVETIQARSKDLSPMAGENNLLLFRDEYIPLINLRTLFNLPSADNDSGQEALLVAIVENGGHKTGLIVDELYGQQQVVIKSLEVNFKRIEGLTGATILGDGSVALILDIAGLMKRGLDHSLAQSAIKRNSILRTQKQESSA